MAIIQISAIVLQRSAKNRTKAKLVFDDEIEVLVELQMPSFIVQNLVHYLDDNFEIYIRILYVLLHN